MSKEKAPVFCHNCGNKLEQKEVISFYDEQTGEPQYRIRVSCEHCEKEGNVPYFRKEWEVENE